MIPFPVAVRSGALFGPAQMLVAERKPYSWRSDAGESSALSGRDAATYLSRLVRWWPDFSAVVTAFAGDGAAPREGKCSYVEPLLLIVDRNARQRGVAPDLGPVPAQQARAVRGGQTGRGDGGERQANPTRGRLCVAPPRCRYRASGRDPDLPPRWR